MKGGFVAHLPQLISPHFRHIHGFLCDLHTVTTEEEGESGGRDHVEEMRKDMEERGKENCDMRKDGAGECRETWYK